MLLECQLYGSNSAMMSSKRSWRHTKTGINNTYDTHQTLMSVLQACPTRHILEQHWTWSLWKRWNAETPWTFHLDFALTCQDMYSQVLMWHPFFLELLQHVGPMMRPVCNRAMSMLCLGLLRKKRLVVWGRFLGVRKYPGSKKGSSIPDNSRWKAVSSLTPTQMDAFFLPNKLVGRKFPEHSSQRLPITI